MAVPESSNLSAARLAADRRNALKSTGPKKPAGKRRVPLNKGGDKELCSPELERDLRARGEDPRDLRRMPNPTRERDYSLRYSLRATTHRVKVTRPRPNREWTEGRMVTDVVELRELIGVANRHFHHPCCRFGAKAVLQTNRLLEAVSVFGHFWGYQIVPNFTNFYQKCVAKRVRRGSKRHLTRGFSPPIYLIRVKSGGPCQPVISAPYFQGSCTTVGRFLCRARRFFLLASRHSPLVERFLNNVATLSIVV